MPVVGALRPRASPLRQPELLERWLGMRTTRLLNFTVRTASEVST